LPKIIMTRISLHITILISYFCYVLILLILFVSYQGQVLRIVRFNGESFEPFGVAEYTNLVQTLEETQDDANTASSSESAAPVEETAPVYHLTDEENELFEFDETYFGFP